MDEEANRSETKEAPKHEEKNEKKEEEGAEGHEHGIHFKMVEVITGISELGYVKITTVGEIPDKPKVVVKGANYLLSKAKGGGEEEEGHGH